MTYWEADDKPEDLENDERNLLMERRVAATVRHLAERRSAQYNLGVMYDTGRGVPQDYAEAVRWYRKAADQGHAKAQSDLGVMYKNGEGVSQDYAEAVKWYRKAAEQGYALAQSNLGVMYGAGKGVPQNYIQAHMWYNLAATQGNEIAKENRDIVAKRMTPAQIAESQELARKWFKEHSE